MPKLPRDINGLELAVLLKKFGYSIDRQTGSHMRLTGSYKGTEHHITIPAHDPLKIGTLNGILSDIAAYLKMDKNDLIKELFQ